MEKTRQFHVPSSCQSNEKKKKSSDPYYAIKHFSWSKWAELFVFNFWCFQQMLEKQEQKLNLEDWINEFEKVKALELVEVIKSGKLYFRSKLRRKRRRLTYQFLRYPPILDLDTRQGDWVTTHNNACCLDVVLSNGVTKRRFEPVPFLFLVSFSRIYWWRDTSFTSKLASISNWRSDQNETIGAFRNACGAWCKGAWTITRNACW